MNKQDEEKAVSIAESCIGERTRNHPANQLEKIIIRDACLEIAAWKEQQMIEKAISWIGKNCIKYNEIVYLEDNNNVPTHIFHLENFIEDFKKYMEEN